jgi:chromate transporter
VDGITAAVVGALVGSVFVIATRSIVDAASAIIAVITILSLIYIKKLQEPYIILAAAIVGFFLKTYL